ncbi:hypothetical protein RhiirA4_540067 [Rhizophagus irregularis]|uniref:BTB domain-containing protein n=1 Tax=Rhizophagus irregularis TaxID=588596 RepID=A0A2I1G5W3_9GLOM|nr:hypothetical protein RhiirA4_540067 [Rhizophagus irregularis]
MSSEILLLARLSKNFENLLLNSDNNHDMIINVGNESNCKTFYAHSLILSSQSEYFQSALSSDWIKKDGDKIIFDKPNVSPINFDIILKHLYCGTVSLNELTTSELLDLLSSTDEFMLPELMNFTESHLLSIADSWIKSDLIKIYLFVRKFLECKNLQEFCVEKICENPESLFNSDDFINLSEEILINLLKRDYIKMKEVKIWEYVINWGTHKCSNNLSKKNVNEWKKENFDELWEIEKNLVELIRFNEISSESFSNAVRPYSLMFPREMYENLLWNYIKPQQTNKSPRNKKLHAFASTIPSGFGFGFGQTTQPAVGGFGFGQPASTQSVFGFP